jgi:hypothetical protein
MVNMKEITLVGNDNISCYFDKNILENSSVLRKLFERKFHFLTF